MKAILVGVALALLSSAANASRVIGFADAPSVVVNPSSLSTTIPTTFVCISMETSAIIQPTSLNSNTGLKNILSVLGPNGCLRVGGNTSDTVDLTLNMSRVSDASNFFLSFGSGWPVLFGLNCPEASAVSKGATIATAVSAVLGSRVTYQIGNEVNIYAPSTTCFGFSAYQTQWQAIHDAVVAVVPSAKFAGADSSYSPNVAETYMPLFAAALGSQSTLLTDHTYGAGGVGVAPYDIYNAWNNTLMPSTIAAMNANSSVIASGLPKCISESGSVSGSFNAGIANTIGASLYDLWEMAVAAQAGWSCVAFHSGDFTTSNIAYAPVFNNGDGTYSATPTLYAMLMFEPYAGGRIEAITSSNLPSNVIAFAVLGTDGRTHVLLINKALSKPVDVNLSSAGSFTTATVKLYTAPSYSSTTPTIGGSSITSSGTISPSTYVISKAGSSIPISVPAYSAVDVILQ